MSNFSKIPKRIRKISPQWFIEQDDEKQNKFHGIFLALLLKKWAKKKRKRNCFVYEFAIHKKCFIYIFWLSLCICVDVNLLKSNAFSSFSYKKRKVIKFTWYWIFIYFSLPLFPWSNSIQVQMLNSQKLMPSFSAQTSTTWHRERRNTTLSEL